jgi:hypothetical protein
MMEAAATVQIKLDIPAHLADLAFPEAFDRRLHTLLATGASGGWMIRSYVPVSLQRRVRDRAGHRCEYILLAQTTVGATLRVVVGTAGATGAARSSSKNSEPSSGRWRSGAQK